MNALSLPADLAERVVGALPAPRSEGELVLYWMRVAVRGHENPALEVATAAARALGLPLLVYQGLDERHPYASDRLWRFALEGARDAARELEARGVRHVLQLTRPGHRAPALRELAARAALVVVDAYPVEPVRTWTERLADMAPLAVVDASCVVPLGATRVAPTRAFAFRQDTASARERGLGWTPADGPAPARFEGPLGFEPVDAARCDDAALAELVAACEIDHGVGPVHDTRGGAAAGYARWNAFVAGGLARYARDRNDALASGVSRMSAYLHFGMVSPFRVAREAARAGGDGADKFLDELLVWRELAWHFCHHRRDVDTTAALPDWARTTLEDHAADPRRERYSWETLARGRTHDELWNAAQRSLLVRGELHNNLRMTWGKALPQWTDGSDEALRLLIDLNHRFALDGRDPSSYGGLLWCLGQFDRPFPPAAPVLGTVRGRSTAAHAKRLDVPAYARRTGLPAGVPRRRIAVIGAGLAGLTAAGALEDAGHRVLVVDKGRGPGGRASTRRADPWAFDHGAQYFTARDARFRRFVDSWVQDGVAARWEGRLAAAGADGLRPAGRGTERFVGTPGMSALARHLSRGLDVRTSLRVTRLERDGDGWQLVVEAPDDAAPEVLGPFDDVLVTAPAPQAAALLAPAPHLADLAASVEMLPCWAAMVALDAPLDARLDGAPVDGLFVDEGPLAWAARNSSKPGRPAGETWVLHATPEWTRAHVDDARDEVAAQLVAALTLATGASRPRLLHADAHRWMFSAAREPATVEAAYDARLGLGIAGDWLAGSKVQGAWLSGRALAGRVVGALDSADAD